MVLTATLISRRPTACSRAPSTMAATLTLISLTCSTIRASASPVSPTRPTPVLTCSPDWLISALISLAAVAERWASSRTSCATTAKPLPASPARAASTPAFRASRLVWKAISSITPMMLVISFDDFSIAPMALIALPTISPERSAFCRASITSLPASSARRLESATVWVISSRAAAVSSTEAACCSVRRDRSSAADFISPDPAAIALAFSRIPRIASRRRAAVWLKSTRSCSRLGMKARGMSQQRSPDASDCRPLPRVVTLSTRPVTSVANFTTLMTLPSGPRIGL